MLTNMVQSDWRRSMLSFLLLISFSSFVLSIPCARRNYSTGFVCVCNATYCDDVENVGKIPKGSAVVYSSAESGKRLERKEQNFHKNGNDESLILRIDPRVTYQKILGFGGAFTDSAGENIQNLTEKTRKILMKNYFSRSEGIGYTMGRVPMASTDFSRTVYSYDETPEDFQLEHFSLCKEDLTEKIPLIQEAIALAGGNLRLVASPWSAPAWMKTTGKMAGPGQLKGDLNGPYYQTWAQYFVRFFEEYAKHNISFWAATVQNEPTSGSLPVYKWQTMFFNSEMQKVFIRDHLGPALQASNVSRDTKIIILDDNRLWLPQWAKNIYSDPVASSFVWGVGVHWYLDMLAPPSVLQRTHDMFPDKHILATEASAGNMIFHGPILGSWERAERYVSTIIDDLTNWAEGWIDWNLGVDSSGGPTWVGNYLDAPIIVNASSDEFLKQPMFYTIAHFSKFIEPGAKRVNVSGTTQFVQAVAFTKEGKRMVVILNRHPDTTVSVRLEESLSSSGLSLSLEPHSITTVLWNKE